MAERQVTGAVDSDWETTTGTDMTDDWETTKGTAPKPSFGRRLLEATPLPLLGEIAKGPQTTGEKIATGLGGVGGMLAYKQAASSIEQLRRAKAAFAKGDTTGANIEAAKAIPIVGPIGGAVAEDVRAGNWPGLGGTISGVAASLLFPKLAGKTAGVVKGVMTAGEPMDLMIRAIKPISTRLKFPDALERAMPELKATEPELGRPIAGVADALDATERAKARVWNQYEQAAGPARAMGTTVDLTPVVDAVVKSIPESLRLENPIAAAKIAETAEKYRGRFPLQQAEQFLKEANAELDSYYGKYPRAQRSATTANPDTAQLVAKAEKLREAIYKTLDAEGEGAAPREIKQRYGALLEVENQLHRRKNVAARQQPESLSEQVGRWSGYGDIARGAFKAVGAAASGQPELGLSAVGDIVSGVTKRQVSKWLKEQQTSDNLIKRAFENYGGAPADIDMPGATTPRALLGPPALQTPPPPDVSGVLVSREIPLPIEGESWGRIPASRQLPPPRPMPLVTPPPPDVSGISVTGGKPIPIRDKTGRILYWDITKIPGLAEGGIVTSGPPRPHPGKDDIVDATTDTQLNATGKTETKQIAAAIARKGGVARILASPWDRARQTADILGDKLRVKVEDVGRAAGPWALGALEGQKRDYAKSQIARYVLQKPDMPPPGPSKYSSTPPESFNRFRKRTLAFFRDWLAKDTEDKELLVTHSRDIKLLEAWIRQGAPDDLSIDSKFMAGDDDLEQGLHWLHRVGGRWRLDMVDLASPKPLQSGRYLLRHGITPWSEQKEVPANNGIRLPENQKSHTMEIQGRRIPPPVMLGLSR